MARKLIPLIAIAVWVLLATVVDAFDLTGEKAAEARRCARNIETYVALAQAGYELSPELRGWTQSDIDRAKKFC